jgi:hypothetical protein
MEFTIGQKIVCIDARYKTFCAFPLKKGKIYTVSGFFKCECSSEQLFLHGISQFVRMGCACNRTSLRRQSYFTWRFKPLQYYNLYKDLYENVGESGDITDIPKLNPKTLKTLKTLQ